MGGDIAFARFCDRYTNAGGGGRDAGEKGEEEFT
jgi:hypothetical protein